MIILGIGVIIYLVFCVIIGIAVVAGLSGLEIVDFLKEHKYVRRVMFAIAIILIIVLLINRAKNNSKKVNLTIKDNSINEKLNDFKNTKSHSIKVLDDNSELIITDDYKIYNYNGEELGKLKKGNYKIENGYIYNSSKVYDGTGNIVYDAEGKILDISASGIVLDRREENNIEQGVVAKYKLFDIKNNRVLKDDEIIRVYAGFEDFFKTLNSTYENHNGRYKMEEKNLKATSDIDDYEYVDALSDKSYNEGEIYKYYGYGDCFQEAKSPITDNLPLIGGGPHSKVLSVDNKLILYDNNIEDFSCNKLKDTEEGIIVSDYAYGDVIYITTNTNFIYGINKNMEEVIKPREISSNNIEINLKSDTHNNIIKDYGIKNARRKAEYVFYSNDYFYDTSKEGVGVKIKIYNNLLENIKTYEIPVQAMFDKDYRFVPLKDYLTISSTNGSIYLINGDSGYIIKKVNFNIDKTPSDKKQSSIILEVKKGKKVYILNTNTMKYI